VSGRVGGIVGHDFPAVGPDCLHLTHGVQVPAFKELDIDSHEWFESGTEFASSAAYPLCHRTNLTVLAAQHGDDAVCLTQFVGSQHNGFVTVERHESSIGAKAKGDELPRRPPLRNLGVSARLEQHGLLLK
jgi:hypothetical protein